MLGKKLGQLSHGPAVVGFIDFADFSDYAGGAFWPQNLVEFSHTPGNPVRGLVKSNGSGLFQPFLHAGLPPFFLRNEAFEDESITG